MRFQLKRKRALATATSATLATPNRAQGLTVVEVAGVAVATGIDEKYEVDNHG